MRRLALATLGLALFGCVVAGGATGAERRAQSFQGAVLASIDTARAQAGLSTLRESRELDAAAAAHTYEMAARRYFGHGSSTACSFRTRLLRFFPAPGRERWRVGEILFWGTGAIDARAVVEHWLASREHRSILLGRAWRLVGVAVAEVGTGIPGSRGRPVVLVTADFGART
jgi:uncharacterized protein YkwD